MCRLDSALSPLLCSLLFTSIVLTPSVTAWASERPAVLSMVAVVDEASASLESYAEISGEMDKVLPTENEHVLCDVLWSSQTAGDFGWMQVRSRLTGDVLLRASVVWMGMGRIEQPSAQAFRHDWKLVPHNPEPATFLIVPGNRADSLQARALWERVRDTDFVERVDSAPGSYEVVAARHSYGAGGMPPETDWFFLIFSRPRAPEDVSLLQTLWPQGYTRTGSNLEPEIRIHNFSDTALPLGVRLTVGLPGGGSEVFFRNLGAVPADRCVAVRITPFPIEALGSGHLSWQITDPSGGPWRDFEPANDRLEAGFTAVSEPVYRPVSSIRHPGAVPSTAWAIDFDGDGDADIFTREYTPRILRNDGDEGFQDITEESPVTLPHWPRMYVGADFTSDGNVDVMVGGSTGMLLLRGEGDGHFTDITADAGLDGLPRHGEATVADMDGDEDPDLVFPGHGSELLLRNDGGSFTNMTATSGLDDLLQTESIAVADLDADGRPDLVLANWDGPSRVYRNLGGWSFTEIPGPFPPELRYQVVVLDYDRDGVQDILFMSRIEPLWLCRGLGAMSFEVVPGEQHGLPSAFRATTPDLNGDGWTDLLLEELDRFCLYLNEAGRFVDRTELLADMANHFLFGALGTTPQAQWIDFDGDGDLDLHSQMVTFLDTTQGTFPPYVTWSDSAPFLPVEPEGPFPESPIELQVPTPCPFTTETRVVFRADPGQHVRIDVFDVAGRRVARLLDGTAGAERREMTWDGRTADARRAAAGIYYLRLTGGSRSVSRTVVLLRQ